MYRRKPQGWLKHIDFLLLDMGSLVLAFVLACAIRHGGDVELIQRHYSSIFYVYLLAVILLHIVNNTFSGVLRRGYYKEMSHTIRHVVMTELAFISYLYVTQQGETFSRLVIGLIPVFYAVLSYR